VPDQGPPPQRGQYSRSKPACGAQALEPVRAALNGAAAALSISAPDLLQVVDKSLPTAAGLAGVPPLPCDHCYCRVGMRLAWRVRLCPLTTILGCWAKGGLAGVPLPSDSLLRVDVHHLMLPHDDTLES